MVTMILIACAALALVVALLQLTGVLRLRSNMPAVCDLKSTLPLTKWPRLSLIVPAKDEATTIEAALRSKLACGYPNLEVVVVDDRSTDETSAIVSAIAARDERVRVKRINELPPGWLGKVHALKAGTEEATGEWLLFSDADVCIERGVLEHVVSHAEGGAVDFVAVMARMDPVSALVDACVGVLSRMGVATFRMWAANDDRSRVGLGVGAFNLVRKRALQASAGLRDLRMEILDDVQLGAMLKASGARCRLYAGRSDVHVVYAEKLGVLARSLEKNGHVFGFSALAALVAPSALFMLEIGVAVIALMMSLGNAQQPIAIALAAGQLATVTLTQLFLARHFDLPIRGALLWPIGVVLVAVLLARAGLLAWWRQGVMWRGTLYEKEIIVQAQKAQRASPRSPLRPRADG